MTKRRRYRKHKTNYMLYALGFILLISLSSLGYIFETQGIAAFSDGFGQTTSTDTSVFTTTSSYTNGGGGGGGTTSGSVTTRTSTFSTFSTSTAQGNTYWNTNSQKVADLVVSGGWNTQVQMLHDINEPGCNDYVGGYPCDNTYWTTSDNIPTCWTLGSFGYTTIMNQCIATNTALGAFQEPRDGMRYEAYVGSPIITGNVCCTHTLLQPNGNDIQCPQTGCSGYYYGTINGVPYAIQSDAWNGNHKHSVNLNGSPDSAAPQAINAWLRGDKNTFTTIENNLIASWDGTGVNAGNCGAGCYSTWQLGQVMFVMRVGGQDNTNTFRSMVNELWSIQNSQGYLPNTYNSSGGLGGHDPENMDAGLLPFCYVCVQNIVNNFGEYNLLSAPQ